ncbi:PIN domain-containing protein [Burkholderia lata]|uniref:PIN domain-containing protein n=1 Tax=Burkholderia lata (strain ATCC 17760 / DSM 23089 / LMG 22485 / NCIMB 9086 / R18194 / 383) TaxID=482957 RepID=UPI0034A09009
MGTRETGSSVPRSDDRKDSAAGLNFCDQQKSGLVERNLPSRASTASIEMQNFANALPQRRDGTAARILVDTCVWLDLAKDFREQPVGSPLERLIANREVKLILPQQVLHEFDRNRARIIDAARRGIPSRRSDG